MIQALKLSDQVAHTNFTVDMLERIDTSPDFLHQMCFLDEMTLHVSGVISRYNCRIWGSQNMHVTYELERGSTKVNVWAGLMHEKLSGPFLFSEKTVTRCLLLGRAGAVCAAPITTSNYPPTRWGTATFLPPCWESPEQRWLGDG
jgi:hypothetical protein